MEPDAQLAPLEDACTVVLLREGRDGLETLMLERPGNSRAFGGAWVFPGGKVDPEDRFGAGGMALDDNAAARAAGLRELEEETGQRLSPDDLLWLAQWTPMQRIPRRFRTWFMVARAVSDQVVLNPGEHEKYAWLTPAEALNRHAAGTMTLIPPTWVTLHQLTAAGSVEQALADARNATPLAYNTHWLKPDGDKPDGDTPAQGAPAAVVWEGDADYPGSQRPASARHRLTMTALPWVFEHNL
ncbi:NUDIX hydrolase [Arthrobacter sp. LAPM80]|uniref:NUDIX hydrolase n=1 Tax=Arthrobacter sp. LAPM80 TaxID=3141788 RepID=UPI00398AFD49